MDNIILPDKVLNQQVCTECLNYLSVGPVMVSSEGKIICGRCRHGVHPDLNVLEHSLYNLVAKKLVFKCINYYGGCEELLLFNEALEHEKTCKRSRLKCPFCGYDGNGCQLIHHFDKKHRKYVIKEDSFNVNVENKFSRNLVYIKGGNVFCLTFFVRDTFIEIFNLLVTPTKLGPKYFKLEFFQADSNVEFVTPPIEITSYLGAFLSCNLSMKNIQFDTNTRLNKNSFLLDQAKIVDCFPSGCCLCKIKFVDTDIEERILKLKYSHKIGNNAHLEVHSELPSNILETPVGKKAFNVSCVLEMSPFALRKFINSELYLLQNCVNCKKYITTVYLCPMYHMACHTCSGSKCSKCKSICHWNNKSKIHEISLPCEWNGCRVRTNIFNYTTHKQTCKFRMYQCPNASCGFTGCLSCLKLHWHMNPLYTTNMLDFGCEDKAVYWLIPGCNEIFYITFQYNPISKESLVTVEEVNTIISKRYDIQIREWRKIKACCGLEFGMFLYRAKCDVFTQEPLCSMRFIQIKASETYVYGYLMTYKFSNNVQII